MISGACNPESSIQTMVGITIHSCVVYSWKMGTCLTNLCIPVGTGMPDIFLISIIYRGYMCVVGGAQVVMGYT